MKITPEQAREALDAWICRPGMTQEQATILITEAFWALKERPNIDVQRVTYEGGAIDQRALGVSREDLACAQWIWGRIVGLYEQAASDDGEIMRPKEPNWTAWANDVRTMRMLDGRSHRQICEMFGRVQRDPFWVKNIMSPSKLREKWDELVIRLGRSPVQRCVNHISEPDTEIPPGFRG